MAFSSSSASTRGTPVPIVVDALGVSVAVTGLEPSALAGFPASARGVDVSVAAHDPLSTITEFTRVAVERTRLLCVHAGVVHGSAGAIAFPGRSGLGKSTLTAALVRAGFGYMSDEVLAVQADGSVRPFARPVTLDAAARTLLGISGFDDGDETPVPVGSLGQLGPATATLASVVLLQRKVGGRTSTVRAKRSDAVASMVENSFNSWRDPRASLSLFVRLVSGAKVWRVAYSDATDLAAVLYARERPRPAVCNFL